MLFFSLEFVLFFALVFGLYWSLGRVSKHVQNSILVVAGLFFYGTGDLRFIGLLLFSAAMNFLAALLIHRLPFDWRRTTVLWLGTVINIGWLGYFKYFEFFVNGFIDFLARFGQTPDHIILHVGLPLGISYYTFQMVGYLIDVHNEEMEPSTEPLAFFAYVFFFPKLLAGPVERARHFLPQIASVIRFDSALAFDGCRQFLWGLFAKVVIAENCARYVDPVFNDRSHHAGSTIWLAAGLYLIQIYSDFSGYSNMAIGTGKILGIRMRPNFRYPLFAVNIADFWRRWHMSLTSWMMDRLFTPLSFLLRTWGRAGTMIATFVTFMVVGIWHGANWTFVAFGILQSLLFIPLVLTGTFTPTGRETESTRPGVSRVFRMGMMFILMSVSFLLLRADTLAQAKHLWMTMFSPRLFGSMVEFPIMLFSAIALFITWEWLMRSEEHALCWGQKHVPSGLRYAVYYALVGTILWNSGREQEFIYFQF